MSKRKELAKDITSLIIKSIQKDFHLYCNLCKDMNINVTNKKKNVRLYCPKNASLKDMDKIVSICETVLNN